MSTPEAGWYPDPSGDTSQLRFWNGDAWTEDYMSASDAVSYSPENNAEAADAAPTYVSPTTSASQESPSSAYDATYGAQPADAQYGAQPAGAQYDQPTPVQYGQPAGASYGQPVYTNAAQGVIYPRSSNDNTLLLIAFIFMIVGTVCMGFLLVPLAWSIPMTVHAWGVYKGKKPNTTAFGVCSLLFVSLVGGILMLCAEKNTPAV